MSKGLEFDRVLVPLVSKINFKSETDKKILYIACTRAMHMLDITCTGEVSGFVGLTKKQ